MRASETLTVGDRAPAFTLRTQKGEPWSLDQATVRGPVLLAFHRGTF